MRGLFGYREFHIQEMMRIWAISLTRARFLYSSPKGPVTVWLRSNRQKWEWIVGFLNHASSEVTAQRDGRITPRRLRLDTHETRQLTVILDELRCRALCGRPAMDSRGLSGSSLREY